MIPEGQDSLHATLLTATLSQLVLGIAKELFPQRTYFDLTSVEKETVADHVRSLLHEVHTTYSGSALLSPSKNTAFPPQREEDYL